MTDSTPEADPKPRRKTTRVYTKKYPVQLILMVSEPVGELVADLAETRGLHKTEVLRTLIHAGIRRAGYGAVLTADLREKTINELKADGS